MPPPSPVGSCGFRPQKKSIASTSVAPRPVRKGEDVVGVERFERNRKHFRLVEQANPISRPAFRLAQHPARGRVLFGIRSLRPTSRRLEQSAAGTGAKGAPAVVRFDGHAFGVKDHHEPAGHQQAAPEAPVVGRDRFSVEMKKEQLRRSPGAAGLRPMRPPAARTGSGSRNAATLRIREMPRSASRRTLRRRRRARIRSACPASDRYSTHWLRIVCSGSPVAGELHSTGRLEPRSFPFLRAQRFNAAGSISPQGSRSGNVLAAGRNLGCQAIWCLL